MTRTEQEQVLRRQGQLIRDRGARRLSLAITARQSLASPAKDAASDHIPTPRTRARALRVRAAIAQLRLSNRSATAMNEEPHGLDVESAIEPLPHHPQAAAVRRATARCASTRRATARSHQPDTALRIIQALDTHPGSTAGGLAKALDSRTETVAELLNQLVRQGDVKKTAHGYSAADPSPPLRAAPNLSVRLSVETAPPVSRSGTAESPGNAAE